jgi:hypothetical protein
MAAILMEDHARKIPHCHRRLPAPHNPARPYYLDNLCEWKETLGCRVYAYCLMTNHVHLNMAKQPLSLVCAQFSEKPKYDGNSVNGGFFVFNRTLFDSLVKSSDFPSPRGRGLRGGGTYEGKGAFLTFYRSINNNMSPEIGDIVTTKEALELCRHFGLGKSGDMT